MNSKTPKRGKKAPPKLTARKYSKPLRNSSHTKTGPGRKAHASADLKAPRTQVAPVPLKRLPAIVGREPRRIWRDGEPVHVVKPVRAERRAEAERLRVAAQSAA